MRLCESCGAPLTFVRMKSGGIMPCDAKVLMANDLPEGIRHLVTFNGVLLKDPAPMERGYVPHWATCNTPDKHRKSKDGKAKQR